MTLKSSRSIAGNPNTTLLKLIALVFMFIDHAGKMCFPSVPEMRMLGRLAFPIYCWCLVVGAAYTRSFPRYLGRIALIGLISQPLYMVALNHPLTDFNIFLTLFLALLELLKLGETHIEQDEIYGEIVLLPGRRETEDEVTLA